MHLDVVRALIAPNAKSICPRLLLWKQLIEASIKQICVLQSEPKLYAIKLIAVCSNYMHFRVRHRRSRDPIKDELPKRHS